MRIDFVDCKAVDLDYVEIPKDNIINIETRYSEYDCTFYYRVWMFKE